MQNNTLLSWQFWLNFYYFLVFSWCLLHVIEMFTKGPLTIMVNSNAEAIEKRIGIKNYDALTSCLDIFSSFVFLTIFFGAVGTMLANDGVKIFTPDHFILFTFALLFTMGFHGFRLRKIELEASPSLQITIPLTILFSFMLFYVFAFKFPLAFSLLYNYPGSLICKLFSIPLFPLIVIIYSAAYGVMLPCILAIPFLPFILLFYLRTLLSHLGDWVSRKYLNDPGISELVKDPSIEVKPEYKELARFFPNTLFAKGLVQNQNYQVTPKDIQTAKKNPESEFALGLANNISSTATINKKDTEAQTREAIKKAAEIFMGLAIALTPNKSIFYGEMLTRDTCICALCNETKKFGAKLEALPFEADKIPLIACLDCHVEKIASFHNISKEAALKLHYSRSYQAKDNLNLLIGRNKPCFCGSGKKYKKCCIA